MLTCTLTSIKTRAGLRSFDLVGRGGGAGAFPVRGWILRFIRRSTPGEGSAGFYPLLDPVLLHARVGAGVQRVRAARGGHRADVDPARVRRLGGTIRDEGPIFQENFIKAPAVARRRVIGRAVGQRRGGSAEYAR